MMIPHHQGAIDMAKATARKLICRSSPFRSLKLPVKCPVKLYRTTARSFTTKSSSISAFRSGMAARKLFDASSTPLTPCGRPEGESAIDEILRERGFRVARLAHIPEGRIPPGGKDHWLRGLFLSGRQYDASRHWQGLLDRGNCSRSKDGNQGERANE